MSKDVEGFKHSSPSLRKCQISEKQKQDSYNFPIVELGGNMSKEERIRRLIPIMQQGRFYFPNTMIYVDGEGRKFDLVQEFIKGEMLSFPKSRFDDLLDSASRLFDEELFLTFPSQKLTMVQRAYENIEPEQENWLDF
jgi:phage terminase large subunit-like protein